MNDEAAERLRTARIKAGYGTAQAAADAFGWNGAAYRHHENGTRSFDVPTAVRYARAFKVNAGWLLALDKLSVPEQPAAPEETNLIDILGTVAAGVWREAIASPEPPKKFEAGPNPHRGTQRFAVIVDGRSMDLTLQPGSVLECLRVGFGEVEPEVGDLVIVQRCRHELIELTCKRLAKNGDQWELRAESSLPEFQEPIPIGKPDPQLYTDDEVRIIGIVIRSYQNHFRRRG